MTNFSAWLLDQARPGSTDPLSTLAADLCNRAGRRLPPTPAALGIHLREKGATPADYAAAALAARQYVQAVQAARLTEATR
ncbi:hypothetical protein [Geodermatophilus chilensis]|uniref:hypothetical protein n=1 Tax=Geodermatophilus chilensis TaxID=2035835 RepID=UPI000C25999C|nr:hypothetical protein [Geodermatophilus chilensis]